MRFRTALAVFASSTLAVGLTGCGGDDKGSASATKEVVVDGSSTVYLISRAAVEAYSKVKPDARAENTEEINLAGATDLAAGTADGQEPKSPAAGSPN